jgi:hypothetical protein
MPSRNLTRRSIVGAVASMSLAGSALATDSVAALQSSDEDAALRHLWSDYLAYAKAYEAAQVKYKPVRKAFDAEFPPYPDNISMGQHWSNHRWLWEKYSLDLITDDLEVADKGMRDTIAKIFEADATGLFGIGVKLAAVPWQYDPEDCVEAMASAISNINRLIGSDFSEPEQRSDEAEAEEAA